MRKARAAPGRALDGDRAAVGLDDAVAHAQAKPGAFSRGFGGEERLEHALQRFLRHAGAGVGDFGDDGIAFARGANYEALRGGCDASRTRR